MISGPDKWVNQFQTCSGKYQSPIDIEEELVERVSLPPLVFKGFSDLPRDTTVINNGHTGESCQDLLKYIGGGCHFTALLTN